MMDYKPHDENKLQLRSLDTTSSITNPETEEIAKKVNSKIHREVNL